MKNILNIISYDVYCPSYQAYLTHELKIYGSRKWSIAYAQRVLNRELKSKNYKVAGVTAILDCR